MSESRDPREHEEEPIAPGSPAGEAEGAPVGEGRAVAEESDGGPEAEGEAVHEGILRDYFETILVAVLIVLFLQTFVFQQSKIPSASMEDTLLVGDHILVNKFVFSSNPIDLAILPHREPRRGDIVVFRPPHDARKDYIKRIIGLPGDVIALRDGHLFRNYERVDEPHTKLAIPGAKGRDFAAYTVPEGKYFVMGDNRDESQDSREWGPIPRDAIHGRAVLVWFSLRPPRGEEARPADPWQRVLWSFKRMLHFPRYARWDRTLRPIR